MEQEQELKFQQALKVLQTYAKMIVSVDIGELQVSSADWQNMAVKLAASVDPSFSTSDRITLLCAAMDAGKRARALEIN